VQLLLGAQARVVKPNPLIVGGQATDISVVPYQVALIKWEQLFCGGSILNARYVLTAAHCTDGETADLLSVRAGSSWWDSVSQEVDVARILQNPRYNADTVDYDVAVLQLSGDLKLSEVAKPVALVGVGAAPAPGTLAIVSGWGDLSSGGSSPAVLQSVQIRGISHSVCEEILGITDRMTCYGDLAGGKDSCQGDSGGPLAVHEDGSEPVLVGVVSWGIGCGDPGMPGVYTDLANQEIRQFIDDSLAAGAGQKRTSPSLARRAGDKRLRAVDSDKGSNP